MVLFLIKTTINVSDANVASLIQQKVAETSQPQIRFDKLVVNPRQNTLLWNQALGREFGDRIKVRLSIQIVQVLKMRC